MLNMNLKNTLQALSGAAQIAVVLPLSPLIRRWYNRWGAAASELKRTYPGDTRVVHPKMEYTRAITIAAPPREVWAWLIQIGQGRAGLYSYDALENLVGCDIHSADRIVPEWQNPRVSDPVRLGKPGYPVYQIVEIQPERALVMAGADPNTGEAPNLFHTLPDGYVNAIWTFYLEPLVNSRNADASTDAVSTRLIVHARNDYDPSFAAHLIWHITEPLNFVMEQKMLRGIKARAERHIRELRYQHA